MSPTLQCMKVRKFRQWLSFVSLLATCMIALCFFFLRSTTGQSISGARRPAITLDPPTGSELQAQSIDSRGHYLPAAPANFRRLGEVKAGKTGAAHTLTLRFGETVSLTHIKSTKDFPIIAGGSCVEGNLYVAQTTCTLLVRFTPKGPGNRLGHLRITYSGSLSTNSGVQTASFGLGGYGYSPVISFIPSVITTVPGSFPSGVGLLNGAQNLAIDGGDTLWVSDTGNNVVRNLDSGGNFLTLASGFSAPWGITVDTFGEAYFSRPAANALHEIYDYGPVVTISGSTTGACPASSPCTLSSHLITKPGEMSMDPYNHMFFTEQSSGGAFSTVQPVPASLIFVYDPFPYQTVTQGPAAMDASDNIYSFWGTSGNCQLVQQSLYNAENNNQNFNKIAGGHTCGFSGDGGLAGNAEIGNAVGQIAFDTAGDLYFTDSSNQRVRRIDYTTGVIRTVAGNGTAGYTGDNGKATAATLNSPTGVGVDSTGSVYIISSAASGQVIRKVGPQGYVAFGNQGKGTASAPQFVTITNTGNSTMVLTNAVITGTNAADFKIDNTTTNCLLTAGASLAAGQTCRIGIIFTPAASAARQATLTLLDNTINGADGVTLTGTGTLPTPTLKITSPANGSSFPSGTAVTLTASVTSASGPAPTGKVQFKVDGANYGSAVALSSGTASTSVTGLTTTTHTLSATYTGDANYAATGPVSVSITITSAAVVKFTSPLAGQSVASNNLSLGVKVSASSGPIPSGTVKFTIDGTVIGSTTLVSGKATMNTGTLVAGSHKVVAAYSGNKYHPPAKASEIVTLLQ